LARIFVFPAIFWQDLIPVVTAGLGTLGDLQTRVSKSDLCTASKTPDGSFVVAYMPTAREITVNMASLRAPANAHLTEVAADSPVFRLRSKRGKLLLEISRRMRWPARKTLLVVQRSQIYTNNAQTLGQELSRDVSHSPAIQQDPGAHKMEPQATHTNQISQGFGLGL